MLSGPFTGSSIPGALKEKAEQGTEVSQPHRSCRAEVQHGLWCHSVSAPRDKCQEVITGTIPFQGCPSALCSTPERAPEQDPLSNTFQLQQQGNLPNCFLAVMEAAQGCLSSRALQHSPGTGAPSSSTTQALAEPQPHHSSWTGALKACREC